MSFVYIAVFQMNGKQLESRDILTIIVIGVIIKDILYIFIS